MLFAAPPWDESMPADLRFGGGHGREELRLLRCSAALVGYTDWLGLGLVGRVQRVVTRGQDQLRGELCRHQPVPRAGERCRPPAALARPPGDREPPTLGPRCHPRGGPLPGPHGQQPRGARGRAQRRHRPAAPRRAHQHRRCPAHLCGAPGSGAPAAEPITMERALPTPRRRLRNPCQIRTFKPDPPTVGRRGATLRNTDGSTATRGTHV